MSNNSLEYILFDSRWSAEFTRFLDAIKIPWQQRKDGDSDLIAIPDDLDDATDAQIEAEYERILAAHEAEDVAQDMDVDDLRRVGIQYQDRDGATRQARVDSDTVNRIMSVLSLDELQAFVQSLADEIESGGDKRLCEMD